jgi:hypothetical protein
MGATGFVVHGGLSDHSVLLATFHELEAVQVVGYRVLSESLHEDTVELGFVEVEGFRFGEILEQIVYLLVVYLKE